MARLTKRFSISKRDGLLQTAAPSDFGNFRRSHTCQWAAQEPRSGAPTVGCPGSFMKFPLYSYDERTRLVKVYILIQLEVSGYTFIQENKLKPNPIQQLLLFLQLKINIKA